VKLTTHLQPVPRLRKRGFSTIPLPCLIGVVLRQAQGQLRFFFFTFIGEGMLFVQDLIILIRSYGVVLQKEL
jgi:hypothetical protein